jgi:hypothetical protein
MPSKPYKSENRIQQECYMWFHNTYAEYRGLLFAVPNGGARSIIEGKLFKETGVVSGISDLLLMVDTETFCFELKNIYGHQSDNQKRWQKLVEREGFKYYIIRDLEEFKNIVKPIMKNRDHDIN